MSFDSNADIIAGVSLGGITLLDPIAIHWEYINEHFFIAMVITCPITWTTTTPSPTGLTTSR